MKAIIKPALGLLAVLIAGGAALAQHNHPAGHGPMHEGMPNFKAKAVLNPTKDHQASGWVMFETRNGKMHVWGEVSGLAPGAHGLHIHMYGDCSAPDGTSAGDHFAGLNSQQHGAPGDAQHHTGDMGNIQADAAGVAKFDTEFGPMEFVGLHGILGRGVIVHEKGDDLKTQPSGASGPRIACGVIGLTKN